MDGRFSETLAASFRTFDATDYHVSQTIGFKRSLNLFSNASDYFIVIILNAIYTFQKKAKCGEFLIHWEFLKRCLFFSALQFSG